MKKLLEIIRDEVAELEITDGDVKKIAERVVDLLRESGYEPDEVELVPDNIWEWALEWSIEEVLS